MTWVRLDDGFADHPKVQMAGPQAQCVFIAGLCYCNRYLTDGFIPTEAIPRPYGVKNPKRSAQRLVEVGLWKQVNGGYQVHDFLTYQPSAEKVRKDRADTARRQAEFQAKKRDAPTNAVTNSVTDVVSDGVSNDAPVPDPVPGLTIVRTPKKELGIEGALRGSGSNKGAANKNNAPSPNDFSRENDENADKPATTNDAFQPVNFSARSAEPAPPTPPPEHLDFTDNHRRLAQQIDDVKPGRVDLAAEWQRCRLLAMSDGLQKVDWAAWFGVYLSREVTFSKQKYAEQYGEPDDEEPESPDTEGLAGDDNFDDVPF